MNQGREYKIAIIGSRDAIFGFKTLGIDAIDVDSEEKAKEEVKRIYDSGSYASIFITENWVDKIKTFLDELPPRALPAIVAVPSQHGSTGAGLRGIRKIVEQAVGSDILGEK
ncbi:MAG: V-type ATP synthase subunit F [Candidatus Doudnabacteria bacterium CG10_big_fil_rev_8_21_14_0_10_41_10]|uniref:V-type ATP synthase subunit F n=1 Tax=Candidatus Doudnabacteria bacterium CG10_big_fil_rev_8_21_14_0_10_41_10 TaxID=1974551 RepID=A0A2H0VDV5_9BACT|nr:MAG: V-type ATP synthase subunit F [Candidatus Doudnabacteria bacterium CG10_big_fil_rev_8_21_14_0_10_41_10]